MKFLKRPIAVDLCQLLKWQVKFNAEPHVNRFSEVKKHTLELEACFLINLPISGDDIFDLSFYNNIWHIIAILITIWSIQQTVKRLINKSCQE